MEKRLFTSESVTEGHPDKMCDAISDAILDALMEQDPMSRVACETATTTGIVMVMGEITTKAYVDIQKIVRETVREIGYDRAKYGFDCDTCGVLTAIDEQSADIALGVDKALEAKQAGEKHMTEEELDAIGAGDQGMMFGFASNETEEYMPYPISMAHKLARRLTEVRKNGTLKYLRPDGKTQVTVEYDENDKPVRLDAVVLSTQHDENVTQEQIHEDIKKYVFDEIIPADMVDENTKFFFNNRANFLSFCPVQVKGTRYCFIFSVNCTWRSHTNSNKIFSSKSIQFQTVFQRFYNVRNNVATIFKRICFNSPFFLNFTICSQNTKLNSCSTKVNT